MKIKDVNESNKEQFLNEEAKNIARILKIKYFATVKLDPTVQGCQASYQDGEYTLIFNIKVDPVDAITTISMIGRSSWRDKHKLSDDCFDTTLFSMRYLSYIHKRSGFQFHFPENKMIESEIQNIINVENIYISMFGNGYDAKQAWISTVWDPKYCQ